MAAKWGNYILLLLLRTLKISLKHGRTNVCNMCAVCCVMFSRVWLTWCLPQMNHRGTALWLQSFSCCGGLIGHSAEGLLPFQSLHMELHCCYRHKSFALCLYNFFGVKGAWMLGGAALQRIIRYNILQFNTLAIILLLWHQVHIDKVNKCYWTCSLQWCRTDRKLHYITSKLRFWKQL